MSICYWICGLSGAGKSTLSREFVSWLRLSGRSVVELDGDHLREIYCYSGFTRAERISNGKQYLKLVNLLLNQRITVVLSSIGLFHELEQCYRSSIETLRIIYLDVPIELLISNDPKGLYKRFLDGDERNVVGMDILFDIPQTADLTINRLQTSSLEDCLALLIDLDNGYKSMKLD